MLRFICLLEENRCESWLRSNIHSLYSFLLSPSLTPSFRPYAFTSCFKRRISILLLLLSQNVYVPSYGLQAVLVLSLYYLFVLLIPPSPSSSLWGHPDYSLSDVIVCESHASRGWAADYGWKCSVALTGPCEEGIGISSLKCFLELPVVIFKIKLSCPIQSVCGNCTCAASYICSVAAGLWKVSLHSMTECRQAEFDLGHTTGTLNTLSRLLKALRSSTVVILT